MEQLWAHAKRYFQRELLDVVDFKNKRVIKAIIDESIQSVRAETLKSWVDKCMVLCK